MFRLYSGDGSGNWTQFYDTLTDSLWEISGANGYIHLEVDLVVPILAQYFRAEFIGIDPTTHSIGNSGPRIQELDGFDTYADGSTFTHSTSVPEPSSIALMALGLVGLGFSQRKGMTKVLST